MFFVTEDHVLTFGESRSCPITSRGLSLPPPPCMAMVIVDGSMQMKTLLCQKNKLFRWKSCSLQDGKALLKQPVSSNPDRCILSGPAEACETATLVPCTKHSAQLTVAILILNLLGVQTYVGSYEMTRLCFRHWPGSLCDVEDHFITGHSLSLPDARPTTSQICTSALRGSGAPD
jgi:hypothetical protein